MFEVTLKKRTKIRVGFHVDCILLVSSFDENQNVCKSLNKTKQSTTACKSIHWFSSFYMSKKWADGNGESSGRTFPNFAEKAPKILLGNSVAHEMLTWQVPVNMTIECKI